MREHRQPLADARRRPVARGCGPDGPWRRTLAAHTSMADRKCRVGVDRRSRRSRRGALGGSNARDLRPAQSAARQRHRCGRAHLRIRPCGFCDHRRAVRSCTRVERARR